MGETNNYTTEETWKIEVGDVHTSRGEDWYLAILFHPQRIEEQGHDEAHHALDDFEHYTPHHDITFPSNLPFDELVERLSKDFKVDMAIQDPDVMAVFSVTFQEAGHLFHDLEYYPRTYCR